MTTTSRMILSAALAVIGALMSATAAVAKPIDVVPASNPSDVTADPTASISVGSSPLWQFAVVAVVAAVIAAVVTHLAETRSDGRRQLGITTTAG